MTAKITLTWDNGSSEHVDQIVYRSAETFTVDNLPTVIARVGRNAREYVDTDIVTGNIYFYAVASENDVGEILLSSVISVSAGEAGGDPHWDNVVALFHFEDSFADEKGGSYSSAGTIGYAAGKFGRCMKLITGNSGVIASTVNTAMDISGDFTIEGWLRPDAGASGAFINRFEDITNAGADAGAGWQIYLESSGKISFYRYDYRTGGSYPISQAGQDLRDGQWHHIAATRQGSSLRLFVDGVGVGAGVNADDYTSPTALLSIGFQAQGRARYPIRGDIDEVRITKGVARYTENFTPPTEPFPNY